MQQPTARLEVATHSDLWVEGPPLYFANGLGQVATHSDLWVEGSHILSFASQLLVLQLTQTCGLKALDLCW